MRIVCLIETFCDSEWPSEIPNLQPFVPVEEVCMRASKGKWRRLYSIDEDWELPSGDTHVHIQMRRRGEGRLDPGYKTLESTEMLDAFQQITAHEDMHK